MEAMQRWHTAKENRAIARLAWRCVPRLTRARAKAVFRVNPLHRAEKPFGKFLWRVHWSVVFRNLSISVAGMSLWRKA
jgi:hypothetical protein